MSFFEFPHTRTYDSDLGWIIEHLKTNIDQIAILQAWAASHKVEYDALKEKVDALVDGLIDVISPWDSSQSYTIFDIVEYQGVNYIAVQDVPVGTMITNTDYWQPANTVVEQINAIGVTVSEILENLDYVTPEMYGAVGDGVTDDTAALQAAIDSGEAVYNHDLEKIYKVTDTVLVSGNGKRFFIQGTIDYNGSDAAVRVVGINHNVYVANISAPSGIGIEMYQEDYSLNTAFCHVSNDVMNCRIGIYLHPTNHGVQDNVFYPGHIIATEYAVYIYGGDAQNSTTPSYSGENKFYNGRLRGGLYGIYIDSRNGFEVNKPTFVNCSIESSANAIKMDAGTGGKIESPMFDNLRVAEITGEILNINGNVRDGFLRNAAPIRGPGIVANSTANPVRPFRIETPILSGDLRPTIRSANISLKGVMCQSMGWSLSSGGSDRTWTLSADMVCANRFIPGNGTFEFHMPYLGADGTDEFYVTQIGATYIAKVYGYNDVLIFDGTNRGQGTFHYKGFVNASSPYTQWVDIS